MEHTEVIAAVQAAWDTFASDPDFRFFTKDDLRRRVLAAHPGIDEKRLTRCIDVVWKRQFNEYDEDEVNAGWEQLKISVEGLPAHEQEARLRKFTGDLEAAGKRALQEAYMLNVVRRAMAVHAASDQDTLADVICRIGVKALRDELARDGFTPEQFAGFLSSQRTLAEGIVKRHVA